MRLSHFLPKMSKIVKKWRSRKILVEIFLVGIDSVCFETYFKTKISNLKIFAVKIFFCDLVIFSSLWTVHRKFEKIEVPGRKNQSCREFDGDHFYILDIEFGRK